MTVKAVASAPDVEPQTGHVTLTWAEVSFAANAGIARHILHMKAGTGDAHGYRGDDGFGLHVDGALGELALAKLRDVYWTPVVRLSEFRNLPGDVGFDQVRTTRRLNGSLIVHKNDPDDARFFLVLGPEAVPRGLRYRIAGWLSGNEAKDETFWNTTTGRPAYFVPQAALRAVA